MVMVYTFYPDLAKKGELYDVLNLSLSFDRQLGAPITWLECGLLERFNRGSQPGTRRHCRKQP